MISSDLNPSIWFLLNIDPEKLKTVDGTNYTGLGVDKAHVIGNIRAKSPSGVTFHNNTSMLQPDIDADISLTNSAVASLPTDINGDVLTGNYDFRYTVLVFNNTGAVIADIISIVGGSTQSIVLDGNHAAALAGAHNFVVASALNAGTYAMLSATYNAGTGHTTCLMNTTALVAETPVGGTMTYWVTYDTYYIDFIRSYCATVPTGDLSVESSCTTSTLTTVDNTSYNILCDGTTVVPDLITRLVTIMYPTTIVPAPPANVTTSAATYTLGPNIYTGIYSVTLVSSVKYTLPLGLIIVIPVTKQVIHTVECSTCLCDVYNCISATFSKWISYLANGNFTQAEQLKLVIDKVEGYWMLYSIAIQCGDTSEAAAWCQAIVDLIRDETACCVTASTTSASSVVIPVIGGGSAPSIEYFNSIDVGTYPTVDDLDGIGSTNDIAIDTSGTGNFYRNVAGTWVYQGTFIGPTGAAGADGIQILYNSVTDKGNTTLAAEEVLKGYTVAASALGSNGDYLEVKTDILLATKTHEATIIRTYFDANLIAIKRFTKMPIAANTNSVQVVMEIHRVAESGAGSCYVVAKLYHESQIVGISDPQLLTIDFTTTNDIGVTGEVDAVGAVDDIICKRLTIDSHKI